MRWARGKSAHATPLSWGFLLFLEDRWLDIRVFDVNVVLPALRICPRSPSKRRIALCIDMERGDTSTDELDEFQVWLKTNKLSAYYKALEEVLDMHVCVCMYYVLY